MNEIAGIDQIASQIWRLRHIQKHATSAEAAAPRISAAARKLALPWSLNQRRYAALAAVAEA